MTKVLLLVQKMIVDVNLHEFSSLTPGSAFMIIYTVTVFMMSSSESSAHHDVTSCEREGFVLN